MQGAQNGYEGPIVQVGMTGHSALELCFMHHLAPPPLYSPWLMWVAAGSHEPESSVPFAVKAKGRVIVVKHWLSGVHAGCVPVLQLLPEEVGKYSVGAKDWIPHDELVGLLKSELVDMCVRRGLPKTGTKSALADALDGNAPQ